LPGERVERPKSTLAGGQEDDSLDGGQPREAASAPLNGLE